MADAQDDSADSRASVIGRKRGFAEAAQDRYPIDSEGSADDERPDKRTRAADSIGTLGTLQDTGTSAALPPDVPSSNSESASPSRRAGRSTELAPSEHEVAPFRASGLKVEEKQATEVPPTLATHALDSCDEARNIVAPAPKNWNRGIQSSGLRTSFASKKPPSNPLAGLVSEEGASAKSEILSDRLEADGVIEGQSSSDDDTDDDQQADAIMPNAGNKHISASRVPFKKLKAKQVSQLDPQARRAYRKAKVAANAVLKKEKKEKEIVKKKLTAQGRPINMKSTSLVNFPFRIEFPIKMLSEWQMALLSEELISAYAVAYFLQPEHQRLWVYLQNHNLHTELPADIIYLDLPKQYSAALSPEQLQAYARARTASTKRQSEKAPKNLDTKLTTNTVVPFKVLNPGEVAALSLENGERQHYENGLAFLKATDAATEFLATLQQWPPSEHARSGDTFSSIANGLTFYPRINGIDAFRQSYLCREADFALEEVFDDDYKPIELHKFSYKVFLPTFLKSNKDKLSALDFPISKKAFAAYLDKFYLHVAQYAEAVLHTKDNIRNSVFRKMKASLKHPKNKSPQKETLSILYDSLNPSRPSVKNTAKAVSNDLDIVMDNAEQSTIAEQGLQASTRSTFSDGEVIDYRLNEAQLLLQQKYFPTQGAVPNALTQYCLACAHKGHNSSSCPALSCTLCGAKHSILRCPDRQRCKKCRERGHSKTECPEKLAVPKSELQCDICGSQEHLEVACHLIWRSFDPRPEEILTVRQITVSCYICGSSSHYGPECGLHRGPLYTGGLTWSRTNLQKYIDVASESRALSSGVDYSIPSRKGFSIKDKANNAIMSDDDSGDDHGSFIRPKIQATERGHIRFNDKENRLMTPLPRRPASSMVQYMDSYNSGFRAQEDSEQGMPSEYPYLNQLPTSYQGDLAFQMRPKNEEGRGNNQSAKVSKSTNQNCPKAKGGSRSAARGRGGRGRGRGRH